MRVCSGKILVLTLSSLRRRIKKRPALNKTTIDYHNIVKWSRKKTDNFNEIYKKMAETNRAGL
jgi:hypothetical protein